MPKTEVQMPDEDGTMNENANTTATESSPLDAEPARKKPPAAKTQKRKVIEREFEEVVQPVVQQDGHGNGHHDEPSDYETNSPLDAMADASLLMCQVERIGPGEGPGWTGRNYDDGQGIIQVGYGRVGAFPDDHTVVDRVQQLCGGGQYRFIRPGKKPVVLILGGSPRPLPSEDQGGYPNGAGMNGRGGFDRMGPMPEEFLHAQQPQQRDPFEDPSYDPTVGIDPADVVQTGLNGWFRGGPYNRIMYFVNGVPTRPPRGSRPPAALVTGGIAPVEEAYNPSAYDHSPTGESATRADWIREQEAQRREDEKMRREEEREQRRQDEERRREEARERREEERAAREAEKEERRREDERRREEARERERREDERRKEEREQRRQDEERAREDRKAAAELARIAAEKQAEAVKEAARLTAEAAKEAAKAQAESNKFLFELMLKKQGDGGTKEVIDLGLRIAEVAQGSGGEKSTAGEIADAIKEAAKPVSESVRDSVLAIKGYAVPGATAPGQPQAPGAPAPQQLPGPPAQGHVPPTGSEAAETAANLHLVQYFVSSWDSQIKPSVPVIRQGCVAYGLKAKFVDVLKNIAHPMATPAVIVAKYKQGCAALGNPPVLVSGIADVERMAAGPSGQAWFQGLKESAAAFLQQMSQSQQQPAPQAQQQPATQAPRPDPNAGVDPTRPVIPNAAPPARDPYACDPDRPEIKPS